LGAIGGGRRRGEEGAEKGRRRGGEGAEKGRRRGEEGAKKGRRRGGEGAKKGRRRGGEGAEKGRRRGEEVAEKGQRRGRRSGGEGAEKWRRSGGEGAERSIKREFCRTPVERGINYKDMAISLRNSYRIDDFKKTKHHMKLTKNKILELLATLLALVVYNVIFFALPLTRDAKPTVFPCWRLS
jgi:hypothetical protein